MRGSWRLTRVAGIDVSLHWSFGFLMVWVVASAFMAGGIPNAIGEAVFVSMLFTCVVLHELGHALAARMYGIPTNGITLLPIGGVAQLERIPRNPGQELVIALAGPAVNVVIAAFLMVLLSLAAGLQQLTSISLVSGALAPRLLLVNVALVVFNLLPAFPMDGGRVLRALLAMVTDYPRATFWAARVGQGVALLLAVVGLFWNPMLLLIAAFVGLAAEAELRQVVAEDHRRRAAWQSGEVLEGIWRHSAHSAADPARPDAKLPITAVVVWPTDAPPSSANQ